MSDKSDMRTPFARVTGLGSAGEGTGQFWHQRLTGLANVPLILFLVWLVVSLAGSDRAEMVARFANPLVAGLTVLAIVSVTWHMRIGMKEIIDDYVHAEGLKFLAVIANTFFALAVAGVAVVSVLLLSFGG